MNLLARPCPALVHVRQKFSSEKIPDVRQHLIEKLGGAGLRKNIPAGARIAITAGSRGFGGFIQVLQGLTEFVRNAGAEPIIIPAMGSHGGSTAEGQTELLKALGVTDTTAGAKICSTMETISLGTASSGAIAHLDQIASECDGIIVFGRVKTHPENAEGIASGLLKMTTVGLGKQVGAQQAHSHGLWESVRAVPELTLGTSKILCGVALVENAFREPVALEVVPGNYNSFREADERLLGISKKHFARIPFNALDVLVIDEIGKNISGTGMDPNVIGTWRIGGGERVLDYKRIVALSLTQESRGNGLGIGLADFTTTRFQKSFDPKPTYINLLTATEPGTRNTVEALLPIILESDQQAIETALFSSLSENPAVCRIKNTAELAELWISENLVQEALRNPLLEILSEPQRLSFNVQGNLLL